LDEDPTELLEMPKLAMHLPEVLSVEEIDNIIEAIDMSKKEGVRNRVIIEMLYGSGLRVSELIDVKISNIHFDEGYVCVIGKGNKQRLVPISSICKEYIKEYLHERASWRLLDGFEDYLFINRSGKNISRVAIFNIVKQLVELAGIKKTISPHTFRHSFATHLLEGGANLRDIQQMLGHSSILTTEIYTHIDVEYLRDTIMKFHPKNKQ
jgi:integrase/recombinase XerD